MNTCSLLIPCYNAAQYLPRLWQTVEAQTVPFDEIICYDDGSTDNTADVARELGAKVIQGDRCRGAAYARNQLAKSASCEWIHFHDADDTLDPFYLEKSLNKITQDIDVVVCHADWIDEITHELIIPRRYQHEKLNSNPLKETIVNPIGVISVLCRKEKFLAIGGFDESYSCWEDGDLHVRLAGAGAKFAVVEEVLAFSLRHNRGLSNNQLQCHHCRLSLLKKYACVFDDSLRTVIVKEAEKVARSLTQMGDRKFAQQAVEFCQSLGGNPPSTNNPILIILKLVLPVFWVLQIQQLIRQIGNLSIRYGQDFSRT